MPSTETGLVHNIVRAIERAYPDAWAFKVHGSPYQMTGVPDLVICVQGRFIGAEVKHPKPGESREHAIGRATPGQMFQLRRIRAAGGAGAVVTNVEEALELVADALRGTEHSK